MAIQVKISGVFRSPYCCFQAGYENAKVVLGVKNLLAGKWNHGQFSIFS